MLGAYVYVCMQAVTCRAVNVYYKYEYEVMYGQASRLLGIFT